MNSPLQSQTSVTDLRFCGSKSGSLIAQVVDSDPDAELSGMDYVRFEDIAVWTSAIDLAQSIYTLTSNRFFAQARDLREQLRRAALAVSNNIAEGFERGSIDELVTFLYTARGSVGEVRSLLHLVYHTPEATHLQPSVQILTSIAESCAHQIRVWTHTIEKTGMNGHSPLENRTRDIFETKHRSKLRHQIHEVIQDGHDIYPDG